MKVHILGLGGAGLSALAGWLVDNGDQVSGCDVDINVRIEPLLKKGVKFEKGNSSSHISSDLDWLIHPNIDQSHPEIKTAKKKGIKTSTYFQALGEITKDYLTIAVAGAHGKTTTTSMLNTLFEQAGRDVNVIVGEGFYRYGKENIFVVEACEYKEQFLSLNPDILVITNIAYDHPDFYDSLDDVVDSFKKLISQMKKDGLVIGYCHDRRVGELLKFADQQGRQTKMYGEELISYQSKGWGSVSEINFDGDERTLTLDLPGKHNVYNALAALETAVNQGIKIDKAIKGLSLFSGCRLRLEKIGEIKNTPIILDYGHHPDQIEAVLSSLTDGFPENKIAAVFEPHQYERVWQLADRFASCWSEADKVYLLPIYKVKGRESEAALAGVNIEKLKKKLEKNKTDVELIKSYSNLWNKLSRKAGKFDLVVILSAGPAANFIRNKFSD